MLAPLRKLAPPPRGNPGSATDVMFGKIRQIIEWRPLKELAKPTIHSPRLLPPED